MNAGVQLVQEKRYAEVEAHFQQLLTKRLPPGVDADTRRRLADTLDVLGRPAEANAERECVQAIIAKNPRDAKAQEARGDLLKRKHQYDEACEAFIIALEKTPASNRPGRALIMAKLALAHYEAGRPAETIIWAEISLTSLPNPGIRRSMNGMAGISYLGQGDLERAEQYCREALRLSDRESNPQDAVRYLGALADIQYKQGQFQEAIVACREARANPDGPSEVPYVTEMECLREMGHFEEAREVMTQWRSALAYPQPSLQRRIQAIADFAAAGIEVRAEQPDAALAFLEQARSGFEAEAGLTENTWPPAPQKGDDKMLLWCDATRVAALAQRGDAQEARRLYEDVLCRVLDFPGDRGTNLGTYSTLGRAAFILGDLAECKKLLNVYLDWKPYPVGLLSAQYWLGETHLRLGETDAARDCFRQAAAPGIDSLDARRAAARLNELGG